MTYSISTITSGLFQVSEDTEPVGSVEPLVDEGGGPPDIYEDDGVCEDDDEEEEEVAPPPSSPPAPPPAAEVVGGGVRRPQVKAEPREQEEKHQPAARHFLDELLEDFTVSLSCSYSAHLE